MKKKYDVAVYGLWYGNNYGSIITYYALTRVLEEMNYSYAMIRNPLGRELDINKLNRSHPLKFAKKKYDITPLLPIDRLHELNDSFSAFLLGSDQMWNYHLSRPYGQSYFFDFVADNKGKIAYATSFGKETYIGPEDEKEKTFNNLHRFDAISVRDDFSQKICKEDFNISAELLVDPVFLSPVSQYDELINEALDFHVEGKYIFAYILDPNEKIGESIQHIAEHTKTKVVVVFNESGDKENFKERLNISSPLVSYELDPTVNEWLYLYKYAEYVLTDSFHGTCFSIIFQKPFIVLKNIGRGGARFPFLLGELGLMERMVEKPEDFMSKFEILDNDIDYKRVNAIIEEKRKYSLKWLKKYLDRAVHNEHTVNKIVNEKNCTIRETREELVNDPEFIKLKILGSLLYDYGVRNIVLSPGGRDVPLVRLFENNEDLFNLYRVTDERSAGYFGLGMATKLKKSVACICTSGTAASNYLPAVTEAYYMGVPLIMITADRMAIYHGTGEDQTILQSEIYSSVIRKEITIPEGTGFRAEYQTRRDISDCILETTHNGYGPVHINFAIKNIAIGRNLPKEAWRIVPHKYPHIRRVGLYAGEKRLMDWVYQLKKSQKILIVYGQNSPLNVEQKRCVESFARKFNCVIVTDHISNLDCKYCIKPHTMLSKLTQEQFNSKISPDILITVGGKRLMNDPLTSKVRRGLKNIRHWSVMPDGTIKDFYFRLTSVIEMDQNMFFSWFSNHAGNIVNNEMYYNSWNELQKTVVQDQPQKFNSNYIQSEFFPRLPKNSLLHLGVGQSFIECRKYFIDETVEVYCNMGTNGIDGCTSTFMGQCAVSSNKLCFLIVGDLSFFYDMNSIWNKELKSNIRILMVNNNGSGLLRHNKLKGITAVHNTKAKGWVQSTGFEYMEAHSKEEYNEKLKYFLSEEVNNALFFEVFCS